MAHPTCQPICGACLPAKPTVISARARAYLEELIGIMQAGSINRLTIDWNGFRTSVFDRAGAAQSIPDTYPAISVALGLLGDGHSSFRSPNGTVLSVRTRTCTALPGVTPTLPTTIGYVRVTAFSGGGAEATAFADQVQNSIIAADRDGLIGWIVDLRGNLGGNTWPMIAGVGPVLGDGGPCPDEVRRHHRARRDRDRPRSSRAACRELADHRPMNLPGRSSARG